MANIILNGKTVVTQTGNDEPLIGGNVLMHSNAINTALSGATFPAGHILQIKDNYYSGIIQVDYGTSSANFIHIVSQSITLLTDNPNIIVFASTGEIDRCDGWLQSRIFYSLSPINDANINGATEFANDIVNNVYEPRLCSEVGRGLSNTGTETHRTNVSYHHRVSFTASKDSTYYFALGISVQTTGIARIGNGSMPNIMIMEVKS